MVLLEESRALCQGAGNWQGVAHALYNLGWATLAQGAYAPARTFYEESLARFRSLGDQHGLTLALEGLAALAAARHQDTRAARLLGAAAILRETTSGPLSPVDHARYRHYLAAAQARLDDATWAAAWVAGRELSLEQTVEEALTAVEATAPAAPVREAQRPARREDRLTPREIEVLCLIAAGRPNAAIAEELFVDENTVERHITNLYQKIKDTTHATKRVNRVAAVNYARAQGICPSDP
jgi:non-specific serine/threonine protein kinase